MSDHHLLDLPLWQINDHAAEPYRSWQRQISLRFLGMCSPPVRLTDRAVFRPTSLSDRLGAEHDKAADEALGSGHTPPASEWRAD